MKKKMNKNEIESGSKNILKGMYKGVLESKDQKVWRKANKELRNRIAGMGEGSLKEMWEGARKELLKLYAEKFDE